MQAQATAKYPTSAQKARLVLDLIRGKNVSEALATLRFARKGVARDIEKLLRSAIANAQQKEGFGGDVERLFVAACYANQGPSQKRIRPAPMGRAFRVVKRTAHVTVQVTERPVGDRAAAADQAATRRSGRAAPSRRRSRQARPQGARRARRRGKEKAAREKKTAAAWPRGGEDGKKRDER